MTVLPHEAKLEEDLGIFKPHAKILDVACGDGRNAIYLAGKGYAVDAVDFSEEALARLNCFSRREKLHINVIRADLAAEHAFDGLGMYDYILINHFRLKPKNYSSLAAHLKETGLLWVNGFIKAPIDNPGITEKDLLSDADFAGLDCCAPESRSTYEVDGRAFVRYIWRKKPHAK